MASALMYEDLFKIFQDIVEVFRPSLMDSVLISEEN